MSRVGRLRPRGPWGLCAALMLGAGSVAAQPEGTPIAWPPLTTLRGEALAPTRWAGVPAVVVFWSTDCGYCKRHNDRVAQLQAQVDPRRLQVLGVVEGGDAEGARQLAATRGWRFPIVLDDVGLRGRFTPRRVVPMTCVLHADGRLHQCIPGEMSEADVMELAEQARRAAPVPLGR